MERRYRDTPGNFPDGSQYTSYGVYLEDHYNISQRFEATAGVRYSGFMIESTLDDYGEYDDTVSDVTWSSALTWHVSSGYRLNLKVSRGFRAPNLDDTVVMGKETGVGVDVPSPGLKPVSVMDYELVLKSKHDHWEGDFALFTMDFDGLIGRRATSWHGEEYRDNNANGIFDTGDEVYWKKVNISQAVIWGVEHGCSIRLGAYTLRDMVTYTFGEDTEAHEPLSRIPPVKVMVGIGCTISDKWYAELVAHFAGKQDRLSTSDKSDKRIPPGGTPGYSAVDIRSSLSATRNATLYLVLENLTDSDYKEHGSGVWSPGRGISAGLSLVTP